MSAEAIRSEPAKLSGPPEWWQASATVVGLIGALFLIFGALPSALGFTGFGITSYLMTSPVVDVLGMFLMWSLPVLGLLYFVATLRSPSYRAVGTEQKLIPWIVFFGVLAPVAPATVLFLYGLYHSHSQVSGQSAFGYDSLLSFAFIVVPLFNWICTRQVLLKSNAPGVFVSLMNGVALVASAMFAATLLPGYGGAPADFRLAATLGMFGGLIGAVMVSIALHMHEPKQTLRAKVAGIGGLLGAFCLFVVPQLSFEFHSTMVECAFRSESPEARRVAIRMLRAFGNRDDMLRGSYGGFDNRSLLAGNEYVRLNPEIFRSVFYVVYGLGYNEVTPPWDVQLMQLWRPDRDIAGEVVGERNKAIEIASATFYPKFDTTSMSAQLDWQLELKNSTEKQQEARMEILLPKGGVVSKAVLWVNGQPRIAQVTEAHTAREAYRAVVLGRRDPLLVSAKGTDRIMVQCFPIPPRSANKVMKFQLVIDAPMQLIDEKTARVDAPEVVECNFQLDKSKLSTQDVVTKGDFSNANLAKLTRTAPQQLIVIVDGSAKLAGSRAAIVSALRKIPDNIPTELYFVTDELSSLVKKERGKNAGLQESLKELQYAPFVGGPYNGDALEDAFGRYNVPDNTALTSFIWIHGSQPYRRDTADVSFSAGTHFYDVPIGGGANAFQDHLVNADVVHCSATRVKEDLEAFIEQLCGKRDVVVNMSSLTPALKAKEKVDKLLHDGDRYAAAQVASAAHIVTPVTSAVVLETDADYQAYGVTNGTAEPQIGRDMPIMAPTPVPMSVESPDASMDSLAMQGGGRIPPGMPVPTAAPAMPSDERRSGYAGDGQVVRERALHEEGTRSGEYSIADKITSQLNALNSYSAGGSSAEVGKLAEQPVAQADYSRKMNAVLSAVVVLLVCAAIGLLYFIAICIRKKWYRRPAAIAALVASTGIVAFAAMHIATIFGAFGSM